MATTTEPAARFGWEGQTVEYIIRADNASELVVPEAHADGLEIRVMNTRQVGDGIEAKVAVEVAGPVLY